MSETVDEGCAIRASSSVFNVLPIMAVVFVAYLVIGFAMPVLPLHVHQGLGLGTFTVGLVAGSQFAAALLSRMWAGYYADSRGAKNALLTGLLIAVGSGALYLLSVRFVGTPTTSVAILLLGRALLGAAESFIITGALTLGLALMGAAHTGKVMAWVGTAMYGAFAIGAPAGSLLYGAQGFVGIAVAATVIPLITLSIAAPLRGVAPVPHKGASLKTVARAVWLPGIALAISGVGFAAVTTFVALLFAERGWGPVWLAFTALSVAFMLGRLVFGHLPDKIGGARVALVCILIEAGGQALIWLAPSATLAFMGVTLTGIGYSLVYPGFGVEAIHRAPAESRGLAMGAYTAFLDISLGLSSPALGLIASRAGLGAVFFASMVAVLCSVPLAVRLIVAPNLSRSAAGAVPFPGKRKETICRTSS
jgi:MFS family permease